MTGCFAFLKPTRAKANKVAPNNKTCNCDCKCSSHSKSSSQQTPAEKIPISASIYYDACNPPPFDASEQQQQQRCCGGITGSGLSHSHLPTYGDSQKHAHHSLRYAEGQADSKLSDLMQDVAKNIEAEIEKLDKELRDLSLDMHDHPEIM